MPAPEQKVRLSFQLKVLVPVLAALVLLPSVTLWIVNGYISHQVQSEARQALDTAEAVFLNSLDIRTRNLVSRFRGLVNEPRFKGNASTGDAKTLNIYLRDLLDEFQDDTELVLFTPLAGTWLASAQRDAGTNLAEFQSAIAPSVRLAQSGALDARLIAVGGKTWNVVSIPVALSEGAAPIGALSVATRLGESAMQELKGLTHADIFLLAGETISASTIRRPVLPAALSASTAPAAGRRIVPVELEGEHYFALTDDYRPAGASGNLRYVLLSSFEARLRDLDRARLTLVSVSVAGILVSALAVWFLIRRITQPLLTLRDAAEAVGRGDFTRRIERFSDDECGAVAVAFNGMTENLQASRAELEKAVQSLKTTQAQLIQSEKLSAVGQFVAGVAHELNNPLTSVIGFSELLQATSTDPKQKEQLDHIARNAHRCHKIVHSLLGFSRQHEPERKLVRLQEVAEAVLELTAYDMRVNNITLVREYAADLPPLLGDSHQLQQVVLNIVSNARQALENFRRDGRIVLRTGATGDRVWLRIVDNGPGISPENLKKIFDPFFTTKPQGKGTGLGLSLSYGIVQEHRGAIRAESQPGVGTEFILEFPIAQQPAAPALFRADSTPPMPAAARTAKLRVLVIDDEESILHLVQEILVSDGHDVTAVNSGQAALELILQRDYDVIVSDWKMPGLSGINLYQELLTRKPAAAQRMLFMTGDVIKESFQDFLKQNRRICLPKPFALREFHAAIAGIAK
ncbi:MAG: response regulator [Opitutae bacterium]|nr:response regulator [Opitutae bacterium]